MDRRNRMKKIIIMGGVKIPWYISGSIDPSTCIIAYRSKGVNSYAASKINLINPSTYALTDGVAYPTWDINTGWTFVKASSQYLTIGGGTGPILKPFTVIARITRSADASARSIMGGAGNNICWRLEAGHQSRVLDQGVDVIGTSTSAVPATDSIIAFSYSAIGAFVFYLNGTPDGAGTKNQAIGVDTDVIGKGSGVEYMDGIIAALSIYNTVLTTAQIVAIGTEMNNL
jgi:hypothetical protein